MISYFVESFSLFLYHCRRQEQLYWCVVPQYCLRQGCHGGFRHLYNQNITKNSELWFTKHGFQNVSKLVMHVTNQYLKKSKIFRFIPIIHLRNLLLTFHLLSSHSRMLIWSVTNLVRTSGTLDYFPPPNINTNNTDSRTFKPMVRPGHDLSGGRVK